jgi:5-deoxy-glucuronate isomerase
MVPNLDELGSLRLRGTGAEHGSVVKVAPHTEGLHYIGFEAIRLQPGLRHEGHTASFEVAIVVLGGVVTIRSQRAVWVKIGERPDPFSGRPYAVYLPADAEYDVTAHGAAEIGICAAPAREQYPARLIRPEDIETHARGSGQALRTINNILMENATAGSLLITEVQSPPGNWSSYPPHKHDTDNLPTESLLEETYYFRVSPAQGFAFQRVYTADGTLDQTLTAHDGDLVLVPRGYHVVAAAAGYKLYYLNVLAGPKRALRMSFDPDHKWIMEGWSW